MGKQYLNGVLYDTGEIIKFSPEIYSFEEREVGVWTDGKPLYQKTIDCGTLPNATTKTIPHGISNLDFVSYYLGTAYNGTQYFVVPFVNNDIIGSQVCFYVTATDIILRTSVDRSAFTRTLVTLQYTKTTDTPGSGHYTTNGGEAHHYSTEEQVIGTWVDGKTLYEKTYVFNNVANAAKNSLGTLTTFDSTWVIRSIDGYAAENDSNGHKNIFVNSEGYTTGNGAFFNVIVNSSNVLRYNLQNRDNLYTSTVYVTVKYTKTTD